MQNTGAVSPVAADSGWELDGERPGGVSTCRLMPLALGMDEEVEDAGYVCIWYISSEGLLSFRDRGTFRARWRAWMGGNTV